MQKVSESSDDSIYAKGMDQSICLKVWTYEENEVVLYKFIKTTILFRPIIISFLYEIIKKINESVFCDWSGSKGFR